MASMLLVEDDESVALTLRAVLEQEGHRVEHARGAKDAMAMLQAAAFEAAIMDLHLQDGDGLELLEWLKGVSPATAAIILTGHASLDTALAAARAGAFDYLIKPCDVGELMASIERGLAWQQTAARLVELATLAASLEQLAAERETQLRMAEQRATELEELNLMQREFIAVASHDLRSPLAVITGFVHVLRRRMATPAPDLALVADELSVIHVHATAMIQMLDSLFDVSRLQINGALDVSTEPCDLGDCLAMTLAGLSPDERDRVDVHLPNVPATGEWEQKRIEQVLANLVGNALKYSPRRGRVNITVIRRLAEIEVAVSDEGVGMLPEELTHLFERFQRTLQARASGVPGTGLGLYICRGIITAHGGRIWAESRGVGKGTTFHFTLPATPKEISAGEQAYPPMGKGFRPLVLAVDDEKGFLRFMRMLLRSQGFRVATADTGEQALQLARDRQPDLVLLDLAMPQMNGFEVMRRLKEISSIPVLVVTATRDEPSKVQGLDLGADDYMVKPVSGDELSARIWAVLRRRNSTDSNGSAVHMPAFAIRARKALKASSGSPRMKQNSLDGPPLEPALEDAIDASEYRPAIPQVAGRDYRHQPL